MSVRRVRCRRCGYETPVSWRRRRASPRFCRNCGVKIAEAAVKR